MFTLPFNFFPGVGFLWRGEEWISVFFLFIDPLLMLIPWVRLGLLVPFLCWGGGVFYLFKLEADLLDWLILWFSEFLYTYRYNFLLKLAPLETAVVFFGFEELLLNLPSSSSWIWEFSIWESLIFAGLLLENWLLLISESSLYPSLSSPKISYTWSLIALFATDFLARVASLSIFDLSKSKELCSFSLDFIWRGMLSL